MHVIYFFCTRVCICVSIVHATLLHTLQTNTRLCLFLYSLKFCARGPETRAHTHTLTCTEKGISLTCLLSRKTVTHLQAVGDFMHALFPRPDRTSGQFNYKHQLINQHREKTRYSLSSRVDIGISLSCRKCQGWLQSPHYLSPSVSEIATLTGGQRLVSGVA